jgi:hypothetical protein
VHEYLDVVGNAFIQLTTTGANSFSFKETAVFYVPGIDGTPFDSELYPNGNANITATFTAFGTGSFNGAFTFAGGTINLYQDNAANYGSTAGFYGANDGNLIASFDVLAGGGGKVDALGNPIGNGEVTVFAKADAGDLASGYFFRGNGNDLSMEKILSFAFTNANPVSVPSGRPGQRSGLPDGWRRPGWYQLRHRRWLLQSAGPVLLRWQQRSVQAG